MIVAIRKAIRVVGLLSITTSLSAESHSWQAIQSKSQHAVVQIINHYLEIDDLVPFRRGGSESRGSGFIIEDGYVVTNFHVVKNCIRVFMQMPLIFGQQRLELDVIGIAPEFDLALLKIRDKDQQFISEKYGSLPFLTLGNSHHITRSDELLGIGFPLGQTSPKSATGIVSGYETIMSPPSKIYTVQVTKPSNPGNSGGPLFDIHGDVVAIDVAGPAAPTDNIAYAIPINDFKIIESRLKQGNVVEKPYFGCAYCNAKGDELAQILGNPTPAGCYITRVFKGGLMEAWGVQPGDMLYSINEMRIDQYASVVFTDKDDRKPFTDYVLSFPLGTLFSFELYRAGTCIKKDVQLIFKEDPTITWRYLDYHVDYEVVGGLLIQELSLNVIQALAKAPLSIQAKLYNYQEDDEKRRQPVLVVTQVLAGSLAAEARVIGIGELIQEVNGISVATLDDLRAALLTSTNSFITLRNDDKDLIALNIADLYDQEPRLANHFGYTVTAGIKKLLQQYNKH